MQAVDVVKAAKQTASAELAVDLELLLGRVYSQWKGHTGDALTIYDALAEVRSSRRPCAPFFDALAEAAWARAAWP